jgi:hypothetical protein
MPPKSTRQSLKTEMAARQNNKTLIAGCFAISRLSYRAMLNVRWVSGSISARLVATERLVQLNYASVEASRLARRECFFFFPGDRQRA